MTVKQRALRAELWDTYMIPIFRIAHLVYGVPGMDRALFLPKRRADNSHRW